MEFGIFHEFLSTRSQTQAEAFAQSFAQIEAAENWGLDVVWLAEIHMNPTRSLLTAPLTVAAYVHTHVDELHLDLLAVLEIPDLRHQAAQEYILEHPGRRQALEDLLAVLS